MKNLSLMFVATGLLMAFQAAYASNAVPSHMMETIYPPYRVGDMHNYDGEATVLVNRITGEDKNGKEVILFSDRTGALWPMVELENIKALINPSLVKKEGVYGKLKVYLADEIISISNTRIVRSRLQPSLGGTVLSMQGNVYIGKHEVSTPGLSF